MLQGAPALLEFGGGAFAEGSEASEQGVGGAGIDVECLLGAALRATGGDEDADASAYIAFVREGGQAVGGPPCAEPGGRGGGRR